MADCFYLDSNRDFLDTCIVRCDSSSKGLLLMVLNVLIPGSGTVFSSFMDQSFNPLALIFGVMQMGLAIMVIGWLWSIMHGYAIYVSSCE